MLTRRRVPFGTTDDNFFNGSNTHLDDDLMDAFSCIKYTESRVRLSSAKDCNRTSGQDRTIEFLSVIKSAQARNPHLKPVANLNHNHVPTEFHIISSKIGKDVSNTAEKLESLNLICKKQNEQSQELAKQLSEIIREDLTVFNKQIAQLQQFLRHQVFNKQRMAHSNSVIMALQSILVKMTSDFKGILEFEQQNVQNSIRMSGSRQNISGQKFDDPKGTNTDSQESIHDKVILQNNLPTFSQRPDVPQDYQTPPSYQSPAKQNFSDPSYARSYYGHHSTHSLDNYNPDNTHQPIQALRQRIVQEDKPRDEMVKIEQTIVELGGIFQQLTNMVHEQGEMVQRIDSHIDDAQLNVDLAHTELVKYLRSVASMRSLMLKVFVVLIIFIIFFFFFYL